MASASPFVQAPEDDDQPTGPAAVLLPQQPVDNTPVPWLAGQAPQQPQAAPVAQIAPPPLAQAPTSATNYPAPPVAPTFNQQAYQDLATKKTTDAAVDRKANAPKWYERVAGGFVGFGTGFNQGASAGIASGSKITNQRYDNAVTDSGRKVAADQQQMDDMTRQFDLRGKEYEQGLQGFGAGMQVVDSKQQQSNADRTAAETSARDAHAYEATQANQDLANKKFLADQTQVGVDNGFRRQGLGIQQGQLSLAQQREKFEELQPADGNKPNARTMLTLNQFQGLLSQRDKAYAAAQKNMNAELTSPEASDGDKAAIRQKYDQLAQQMQDEWGQRLAQADPEGKFAPQQSGRQPQLQSQPAQPAAASRGMVRMQRPDGTVVQVPIQNIEKAKQLGGKVIQ